MPHFWKLNTSNLGKFTEFQQLFGFYHVILEATHYDLKEIDANPLQVVAHKASQLEENVIIDDTILEVEGAEIGIKIRWLLSHLELYLGKKARWTTYLAYREADRVYIFQGIVFGTIVSPRGAGGFGFDAYFLPEGNDFTLAEAKPEKVNARALAVRALISQQPVTILPVIKEWSGPWQTP